MRTKLIMVLFFFPVFGMYSQNTPPTTPSEVVTLIKNNLTCSWTEKTVDTFKSGNPDADLTGIAVCMFADIETLRKAVELGCNFIITHEPIFYNHSDDTSSFKNNQVFEEKINYIRQHKLVIFRFHDHIHRTSPDGIREGMIHKTGLAKYAIDNDYIHFQIPQTTLRNFVQNMKLKLNISSVRFIGNPDMKFTKVALMPGAPGGSRHIEMLAKDNVEVLLAGEAPEWETYLFAQDAVALGKNKAVIFLGHTKSEEAGMEYCAEWLKNLVPNTPIHFVANKPSYITF